MVHPSFLYIAMIMTDVKKVSIHLVTYNGEKYIPFCLKSISDQSSKDFNLLIIDNDSEDATVKSIKEYLDNPRNKLLSSVTRFIQNPKNIGFAGAHNQAIQWTDSNYVLMLNQDIILHEHFLKYLIAFMDSHTEAAAATGALFWWNFAALETPPLLPLGLTRMGRTDTIDSLGLHIKKCHEVTEDTCLKNDTHKEVFGISGALPMYRRSALDATMIPRIHENYLIYTQTQQPKKNEYFDNDFHSYKEDIDLAYRLRLFGYQSFIVSAAKAWHDRTAKKGKSPFQYHKTRNAYINYHSYKNHLFFLIKNVPVRIFLKCGIFIFAYEAIKFFYVILFDWRTIPSMKEIILKLPLMMKKRQYIQKRAGRDAWKRIEKWLV